MNDIITTAAGLSWQLYQTRQRIQSWRSFSLPELSCIIPVRTLQFKNNTQNLAATSAQTWSMRTRQRGFEGGQKRWKKKLEGLRDRWISAGWLKCRATGTDKSRSWWCIIDWHHLRARTDTTSPLRCSIQIDKCSIMFWKGRMCLINGWNEECVTCKQGAGGRANL